MNRFDRRYPLTLALCMMLVVVSLAGCAPATGDEPAAAPPESASEGESVVTGSGLATVAPTASVDDSSPAPTAATLTEAAAEEGLEGKDVENGDERGQDTLEETGAVTPAVVDLSKITPEPPQEGELLQEMPQPGIPNPSVAASSKAAADLANHLKIDVSEVRVQSVEQVQWRDSALGCPKPGQNYLMVITPGYRIVLEANGEQIVYHADTQGHVVRCDGATKGQDGAVER